MPRKLSNKENVVQPTVVENPEQTTEKIPVNHFANVV